MVVMPSWPEPLATGLLQFKPSSEMITEYLSGESHSAQVLSKTISSKVCGCFMSTWNHWPGCCVPVMSRQPVQWSPSMALAADASIGILSPLKRNVPSATDAEAVHDFLSSGCALEACCGAGFGEFILKIPRPENCQLPGLTLNFT